MTSESIPFDVEAERQPMSSGAGDHVYILLPGSGSAGLVWKQAAAALGGAVITPLPDEPDVDAMATTLERQVCRLPDRRVLVGASLGALVALELARRTAVDALVLISSGFGIKVHPSVLARIAADAPDLLQTMARGVLADPGDEVLVEIVRRDFEARGQPILLRHMQALASHLPQPLLHPPPTLVLWGTRDPGVPLHDHVQLAARCAGLLVPIAGAGHLPYLEQPHETVRWIRLGARWADAVRRPKRSREMN
jgi:pimeloyl-ACP methyl ester carboxylesterase